MMNFRKLKKWILPLFLIMVGGLTPFIVLGQAPGIEGKLLNFLGQILYFLMVVVPGGIMTLILLMLTKILSYSDFANEPVINIGWSVLRDLGNMFFIAILLTIAIGTILKSSRYGYQQNLRRLIVMAILINFSKTIVLFFIDLSQAVTIAFVNAFIDSLQAGYLRLLGLTSVINFGNDPTGTIFGPAIDDLTVLTRIVLAGIMIIIATLVIAVITFIFALRIIYFAFIIVLAPLAFVASTMPTAKKYYDEWWDTFGKYLVVGPVLAFFLWFAFTMVSQNNFVGFKDGEGEVKGEDEIVAKGKDVSGDSLADTLKRYFIGIALLMGALTMADKLGVAGASMGRAVSGKITGAGKRVLVGKSGAGGVLGLGRAGAGFTVGKITSGVSTLDRGISSRMGATTQRAFDSKIGQKLGGQRTAGVLMGATRAAKGAVGYASGVKAYTAAGRAFAGVDKAQQQKNLSANLAEARTSEVPRLQQDLHGFDQSKARAAAAELTDRGVYKLGAPEYKDKKTQDEDIRKSMKLLGGGGPATRDKSTEINRSHVDLITDDVQRQQVMNDIVREGQERRYLGGIGLTEDVVDKGTKAGIVGGKRWGEIIQSSSEPAKKISAETFKVLRGKAMGDLATITPEQAEADEGQRKQRAEYKEEVTKWSKLGVQADPKQADQFIPDAGAAGATATDIEVTQNIAMNISGDNLKDMNHESIARVAPYLPDSVITNAVRLGIEGAKLTTIADSVHRALKKVETEGRTDPESLEIKRRLEETIQWIHNSGHFKGTLPKGFPERKEKKKKKEDEFENGGGI